MISPCGYRRAGIATLAALSWIVVGCSPASTENAVKTTLSPPQVTAIQVPKSGFIAAYQEPLAVYDLSMKDADTINQARHMLEIACMHARGYADFAVPSTTTHEPSDAAQAMMRPAGPWGYLGTQGAATNGFHEAASSAGAATSHTMPVSEMDTYRECAKQQQSKIVVNSTKGSDLVKELGEVARSASAKDDRVVSARNEWARCMKDNGFDAPSPEAVAGRNWQTTTTPTAEEISTAQADERCTTSSKLAAVDFAILWGYQNQLIENNVETLTSHQRDLRNQISSATRIIANNGATS